MFVRAGSIIPIKLHGRAQALLRTLRSPLRLDVYLSGDGATAEGLLYLDDGESFKYQTKKEKALIKYSYQSGKLTCQDLLDPTYRLELAQDLRVQEVNIFGLDKKPIRVKSPYKRRQYLDFDYRQETQTLTVKNMNYPVDSDVRGVRRMLEIEFY